MKRDEVRKLIPEITDEQLNALMDMNGSDINAAKSPISALQKQLDEANDRIGQFTQQQQEQMTQEERLNALLAEVAQQKVDNARAANRIKAESILSGIGLTPEDVSAQLDLMVSEDVEATVQRTQAFADLITAQRDATKAATEKSMLSKMGHPEGEGSNGEVTKEEYSKMTYSQKLEIKQNDPELYKRLNS